MTDTSPDPKGRPVPLDVVVSEELYAEAVMAFRALSRDAQASLQLSKTERKGIICEVNNALALLLKEKSKYEDACREAERDAPDAPIDFDAARREIGSQLDRIRAAGGSDQVPEQAVE